MEFKENLDVAGCAIDFITDYTDKTLVVCVYVVKIYSVRGECFKGAIYVEIAILFRNNSSTLF